MNEIRSILALAEKTTSGEGLAMATVVNVRGSAYRRPGARMLLAASHESAGMISGGCLENDVRERAIQVIASGRTQLANYDSTAPEEIVFGLGLGCNGIVQILIEPVWKNEGLMAFFAACHERRKVGKIATVFEHELASDSTPFGARVLQWPGGGVTTSAAGSELASALLASMNEATGRSVARTIDLPGIGPTGVLFETISPPVPLVIFGGGDDAVPLVQLAKHLGWDVTVIDGRSAYARAERFATADSVLCLRPEAMFRNPKIAITAETVAVIMTHNYPHDRELLGGLLPLKLRYLGMLGPKARTQRILDELRERGEPLTDEMMERLHWPAGLDVGAESPAEVALSLAAEMQAALTGRCGGSLRLYDGPIHGEKRAAREMSKDESGIGKSSADAP